MKMQLVKPALEYLESYKAALQKGWSPYASLPEAGQEALKQIERCADTYLRHLDLVTGQHPPYKVPEGKIKLPDGSEASFLPGFHRWMWDGEFCGSISFRWQPGTPELPPHVLGHVGYTVVPWKRRRGYATQALRQLLKDIGFTGLPYVQISVDEGNGPSQKVIEANGGEFQKIIRLAAAWGGKESRLYFIRLLN